MGHGMKFAATTFRAIFLVSWPAEALLPHAEFAPSPDSAREGPCRRHQAQIFWTAGYDRPDSHARPDRRTDGIGWFADGHSGLAAHRGQLTRAG
jgi:hypothetical protein